jgi:hypothetical protein
MGFQRMANASPQAILQQIIPQAGQAMSQARQVRRQVGPYGGGQGERTQQQITAALTTQLAQLFARVSMMGQQGLMGIANGTSTMMPAGTRTGTSGRTTPAVNPTEATYGLSSATHWRPLCRCGNTSGLPASACHRWHQCPRSDDRPRACMDRDWCPYRHNGPSAGSP